MNKTQFFKYLASGGRVVMITFHGEQVSPQVVKRAAKVQSNCIVFDDDSRLYHSDVDASEVSEVAAGCEKPAVSVGWAIYQPLD